MRNQLTSPEADGVADAVVTYSRIGSRIVAGEPDDIVRAPVDEPTAPQFDAVEVPFADRRDASGARRGDLGGQTMDDRVVPARGGRSLRFVMLAGVAAIAAGIGVLALAYNNAATNPTVEAATDTAPAKVAVTESEAAIDMTPPGPAKPADEPGETTSPVVGSVEPVAATPATEGVSAGESARDATTSTPPAAEASPVETEEADPVATASDSPAGPPAAPPIPRSRPDHRDDAPAAVARAEEPTVVAKAAEPADDTAFLERIERTLDDQPSTAPATAPAATGPIAIGPVPTDPAAGNPAAEQETFGQGALAERNDSFDNGGAFPAQGAVAEQEQVPQRLVPPADIPQSGPYAEGYGQPTESGWGDTPPQPDGYRQWVVLGVRDGRAIIDGRDLGVFTVEAGSEIPGIGVVESIERRGRRWVVTTSDGFVLSSVARGRWRF